MPRPMTNTEILKQAMVTILTADASVETRSRWLAYLAAIHLDAFVGTVEEAFDEWNNLMVEVVQENLLGSMH